MSEDNELSRTPRLETPQQQVIEAKRGVPFKLFPPDVPIYYLHRSEAKYTQIPSPHHILSPIIRIEGLGEFSPSFGDLTLDPRDNFDERAKHERIVATTQGGPIELVGQDGGRLNTAIDVNKYTDLLFWKIPFETGIKANVVIDMKFPRLTVSYTPEGYDRHPDDQDGERDLYFSPKDDEGNTIDNLLVATDPELLRSIDVTIT